MARRKRAPVTDRTYRFAPGPVNYVEELFGLIGDENVVVWMPREAEWKRGLLLGLVPSRDIFRIKWTEEGYGQNQRGIWRVHSANLFTRSGLPVPLYSARLPQSNNPHQRGAPVAPAAKKAAAAKKPAAKKSAAKKKAVTEDAENGATRTRTDKLGGLSEARKRNIAKLIYRERSKSPATGWDDIAAMILDKYDWELPGSMTGRRLLREYGPEDAESAIIQQDRTATTTKKKTKKKAEVVEEDEDEEDEEVEEDEDEEEMEADEDEDEDEDEEEEAPAPPKRSRAKKVAVRGRGKRSNPSK